MLVSLKEKSGEFLRLGLQSEVRECTPRPLGVRKKNLGPRCQSLLETKTVEMHKTMILTERQ